MANREPGTEPGEPPAGSHESRAAKFVSIEDFGTNSGYAGMLTYHVTEDFFFRADIGQSTAGRTSFENLAGDIELLTGDERRFTYYSLSLGYNFLPGEVFLGRDTAMNSSFYVLGGIGSVDFAGDQRLTLNFGAGFGDLSVDLVQRGAFFGERVLVVVDFRARGLLAVHQTLEFFPRCGQVALERSQLFGSMMCLKHAQICV